MRQLPLKVYLAGASNELETCEHWMGQLRSKGIEITHDWCAVIRSVGDANPRAVSVEERKGWLYDDIDGICEADVFWLIIPKTTSIGCWAELGIASQASCHIVMSGDWKSTIFSALADTTYDTHDEALAALASG